MGKLLSLQSQVEQSVGSAITKAEDLYLSLIKKTSELTDNFYDTNRTATIKACRKLRELNVKAGEAAASVIAKVEKEPSKEEKVKGAVDKAANVTKKAVEKAAKVAGTIERAKDQAMA